ncbi:hypothetical protein DSO57_1007040 [Entomophthora muscae]|uniref:Uncharacterized protein n=1 Tax=Entomophthora muscae TaxID=34485 RepID=A0ACC2RMB0_9FUNG|nr:hypothetical protein DSO57_1007040 [Entomophthora muscae]
MTLMICPPEDGANNNDDDDGRDGGHDENRAGGSGNGGFTLVCSWPLEESCVVFATHQANRLLCCKEGPQKINPENRAGKLLSK